MIIDIYSSEEPMQRVSNILNNCVTELFDLLPRKHVEIKKLDNDNDWEFVLLTADNGKRVMAVF